MSISKTMVKAGFNKSAKKYEYYADLQQHVAENLIKFCWADISSNNGLILDLGSGTGYINQILRCKNLLQLDISENMCKISSNYAPSVCSDMDNIPFSDDCFHGIISSLTLQWSVDLEKSIKEIVRTLKPGSSFAFSIFGSQTLQELKSVFRSIDKYSHVNEFYDENEIIKVLSGAGLSKIIYNTELIVKEYSSLMELMQAIKFIGASNKDANRRKSLVTKSYFDNINYLYKQRFSRNVYIPATWEVIYIRGVKK